MHIVVFDDLPEGGAKRVVFEQIKGLSDDHVVDYVANDLSTCFRFEKYAHEIFRFNLDLPLHVGWLRPLQEGGYYTKLTRTYEQISHLIEGINPDVVLVHPSRFSQAPPLLFFLHTPSVYFAEEWPRVVYEPALHPLPTPMANKLYESWRRKWIGRIDMEATQQATTVTATSRYMQTSLSALYRRPVSLLPLGVDTNVFCPVSTYQDYFLFIGEKESMNGYPLIEEMERIFGRQFMIKYVSFHKGNFRYSDKALNRLYQGAVATLCLAEHEPFGLAAVESMSCGTPVIAVREGGYMDTVSHHRTGILIDRSVRSLRDAMLLLMCNKPLRYQLSTAARKKVEKHFTWKRHILLLEHILNEVTHA